MLQMSALGWAVLWEGAGKGRKLEPGQALQRRLCAGGGSTQRSGREMGAGAGSPKSGAEGCG